MINEQALGTTVPVMVAIMVWIIRILIIGSFSMAGDRLFSMADSRQSARSSHSRFDRSDQPLNSNPRPFQKPQSQNNPQRSTRPEPTYQPVGLAAKPRDEDPGTWR
jgi:hypothetical protein